MRVVLDTNTFGDDFALLENSQMRRLCNNGRVVALYCPVLLDELIAAYGISDKRKELLERWVPFIERTMTRICDSGPNIRHRELVQGKGRKANIYMRPRDQQRAFEALGKMAPDGSAPRWTVITALQREAKRSRGMAAIEYRGLRANHRGHRTGSTWVEYSSDNNCIEDVGRRLLEISKLAYESGWKEFAGFVPVENTNIRKLFDRWAHDKSAYPYFTQSVFNFAFFLHFATERDERFDVNGTNDLEILGYLVDGDIIVSNEKGFLKQAFEAMWKPKGKKLLSVQEFVERIEKLSP